MTLLNRSLIVALLFATTWVLPLSSTAQAADGITNLSVSAAEATPLAYTRYTINFTVQYPMVANDGRIYLRFYGPTNSGDPVNQTPDFATATIAAATSPSSTIASYDPNGVNIKTTAGSGYDAPITLILDNVKNPKKAGYYWLHVYTLSSSNGRSGFGANEISPYFEIGTTTNLKGKITDPEGNGVAAATVSVLDANHHEIHTAYVDRNGDYGMEVTLGTHTFSLSYGANNSTGKTYTAPYKSSVVINPAGVTTKNASFTQVLEAVKTLSGRVTKEGVGVAGAKVKAIRTESGSVTDVSAETDPSGNYSLRVTGGRHYLTVVSPDSAWVYGNYDHYESFETDNTAESRTVDFALKRVPSPSPSSDSSTGAGGSSDNGTSAKNGATGTTNGSPGGANSATSSIASSSQAEAGFHDPVFSSCFEEVLGAKTYEQIKAGKIRLNAARLGRTWDKVLTCFEREANQQLLQYVVPEALAPIEPERIKDLPKSKEITVAKVTDTSPGPKKHQSTTGLSGKIPKAEVPVFLYAFSEPMIFVTKSDKTGQWSHDFNKQLAAGPHTVYIAYEDAPGHFVASEPVNVTIAASASPSPQPIKKTASSQNTGQAVLMTFVVLGLIAATVLFAQHVNWPRRPRQWLRRPWPPL